MPRRHALVLSLLIGLAAVFGVIAASRTVSLGNASRSSADTAIVQRTRALDRYEASLQKALAKRVPALPPVAVARAASAAPVRVVYHRPPPIVITKHRPGGEHESAVDSNSRGGGMDD